MSFELSNSLSQPLQCGVLLSKPFCVKQFFIINCEEYDESTQYKRHMDTNGIIGTNLNEGLSRFVAKDEEIEVHLNPIIEMTPVEDVSTSDVVTWRGILTRIMCLPYSESRDDVLTLNVIFEDGRLNIEEDKKEKMKNQVFNKMCYWGHRFETLVMRNSNTNLKNTVTSNKIEWTHIFKIQLGNLKLLYGAEIDGLDEEERELVELKTHKQLKTSNDRIIFHKKLMRVWAQSTLANVPKIIFGFRDRNGILKSIECLRTEGIPNMVRGQVRWDPKHMVDYLHSFLTKLIQICSMCPNIVFQVHHNPVGNTVTVKQTDMLSFVKKI